MRYLILSDIHSNWEALQAVLRDAEGCYDRIVCLGDFVGYGPDPNLVIEWAREHVAAAVRGNHDMACTDADGLEDFSPLAFEAAIWTKGALSAENVEYLKSLPAGPLIVQETVGDFAMVHGSPRGENEYLVEVREAAEAFQFIQERVTFFGHTHLQGGFEARRGKVRSIASLAGDFGFETDAAYLINPGSVGQPRDLKTSAAYALFEPGSDSISFRRTEYQIGFTQRKIRSAGLPPLLADRLAIGK